MEGAGVGKKLRGNDGGRERGNGEGVGEMIRKDEGGVGREWEK